MRHLTERQLLLQDLYNTNILESRKQAIIDTFPTELHYKGSCYFTVGDKKKAEQILMDHMSELSYPTCDHLNVISNIFFEENDLLNSRFIEQAKLNIPELKTFLIKLVRDVKLLDYDLSATI